MLFSRSFLIFLAVLGCMSLSMVQGSRPVIPYSPPTNYYKYNTYRPVAPPSPTPPPYTNQILNQNCNEAQMKQAMVAYVAGDSGNNVAQTGYDFSGAYPFFNCSTATSMLLEVVDLEDIYGCPAVEANLNFYAPWKSQLYATQQMESVEYYTDGSTCTGIFKVVRILQEYVNQRTQQEIFEGTVYFQNNRAHNGAILGGDNGGNQLFVAGRHTRPDVLIHKVSEINNSESLSRYLFDYLLDNADQFCTAYIPACGGTNTTGWVDYDSCLAYNSATIYSVAYPIPLFIPYGDTIACRNYYLAVRLAGPSFSNSAAELQDKCDAVGPADGSDDRVCVY